MRTRGGGLQVAIWVLLAGLVLAGLFWADLSWARLAPGGADLIPVWRGLRAFFFENTNPYEVEVAQFAAILTGGQAKRLGLPFPAVLLYLPYTAFANGLFARASGMVLAQAAGLILAFLGISLAGWRPSRGVLGLYLTAGLLWLPSVAGWLQGSPAVLCAVLFLGALLALRSGIEELAGALLVFTLARPSLSAPFLVFVLFFAWRNRRWRVWFGFLMVLVVWVAIATLIFPSWPAEFGRAALANGSNFSSWTARTAMAAWLPAYGSGAGLAMAVIAAVVLLVEWSGLRGGDSRRLFWVASLTLAVTPLLGLPVTPAHFTLLWPSFTLILCVIAERWPRRARWLNPFLLLALGAGSWALALRIPRAPGLLFIFVAAAVLGLYWLRWWALHAPRTWLDRVAAGQV